MVQWVLIENLLLLGGQEILVFQGIRYSGAPEEKHHHKQLWQHLSRAIPTFWLGGWKAV
jgi:hypothetical protein